MFNLIIVRTSIRHILLMGGVLIAFSLCGQNDKIKPDKPNVLFIAVDDLRPELGCYGILHIKSPNIDRLASSGMVFENAYATTPSCGPSRASILSGIYPTQTRFVAWNCSQDEEVPGIVSLPMHFKNNDYHTVSLGKVYNNFEDGKGSWTEIWYPPTITTNWDYQSKRGIEIFEELNKERYKSSANRDNRHLPKRGLPFEKPDIRDDAYRDGRIANQAIEMLQKFKNNSIPFFMAVGFVKPHLPFNAPEKYWNMYDEDDVKLPENGFLPENAPDAAKFNFGELRTYYGIPKTGPIHDTTARKLIHGYYASVSYVDAQIGRVLDELENLGMAENTIIVLWGDHGWFLGEHGFWSKYANLKRATHAPLIVKIPWRNPGLRSNRLIEFVDIYPSLCDFAGLRKPVHLQGESFAPLMDNPDQPWKEKVFCRAGNGETIITETHAYTEYIEPKSGESYARMLYNHRDDPEENVNVAELSENRKLIKSLHQMLNEHLKERNQIVIP